MAVYFVTGKLGSGKSLACVSKIREYLSDGRRVATNLDLELDQMFTYCKSPAIRLPDKPRAEDLAGLGPGYESEDPRDYDEKRFGLIVLDECGTWLNSREWNDKGRRALIDWFLHARKHRWDVMFLIQDIESCDAQIVRSLCEHLVICRRMDRFKVMGISLPKVHIANVYYGRSAEVRVERWTYKGADLYKTYDTRQVFRDGVDYLEQGPVDMRAPYTMLSAWHLKGRYEAPLPEDVPIKTRLFRFLLKLALGPLIGAWMIIDRESCIRHAFRKTWLEHQAAQLRASKQKRLEQLRIAYAPSYPPL
ncbi:MAG: hypothetical protein MK363_06255 [Pseudomonas sp.]|jgi:hypothetical protein|nr:hypothetical protein [Pseudomonas sp.]